MEPIFAQLSLEYFLAGKNLPWNVQANKNKPMLMPGELRMVQADLSNAKSHYFNLKG